MSLRSRRSPVGERLNIIKGLGEELLARELILLGQCGVGDVRRHGIGLVAAGKRSTNEGNKKDGK